jgi:hypothetical protein
MFRRWHRPQPVTATTLVGRWKLVRVDGDLEVGDGITMVVTADGTLTTILHDAAGDDIRKLMYHVKGSILVTRQQSHAGEERIRFHLEDTGHLVLHYGRNQLWFIRLPEAPH